MRTTIQYKEGEYTTFLDEIDHGSDDMQNKENYESFEK